jgi:hypothetical protein
MLRALSWFAWAAAVLCGGAAYHEWVWYQNHPSYSRGPSGVLVVLGIGAAIACAVAGKIAGELAEKEEADRRSQHERYQRDVDRDARIDARLMNLEIAVRQDADIREMLEILEDDDEEELPA